MANSGAAENPATVEVNSC